MNITLIREEGDDTCTIGRLWIDGARECWTLEDPVRPYGQKVYGKTAIWGDAVYDVAIDYSPKYGRKMLHVLNVPMFEGIRIHAGNDADDTEGCILVGRGRGEHTITQSREALARLFEKIEIALADGESVKLIVINAVEPMEAIGLPTSNGEL